MRGPIRGVLLAAGVLAVLVALPAPASAKTPCRDRIYNDWYKDGKIASTYPIACYRDALKHVPLDAKVYSSLVADIKSALQAALEHGRGKSVPEQVGHGPSLVASTTPSTPKARPKTAPVSKPRVKRSKAPRARPHRRATTTLAPPPSVPPRQTDSARAASPATDGSSGVPTPLLALGALALALVLAGAVGLGMRRFRRT